MGVGMPADLFLNQFGDLVYRAFGEHAYHVGSSVREKLWRDVDVRVMLADDVYEHLGLGKSWRDSHQNARWMAFCAAFSALGKQMTGLPIDFQVQKLSEANEMFGHGYRSCLGIEGLMMDVMPAPAETGRAVDQLIAQSKAKQEA